MKSTKFRGLVPGFLVGGILALSLVAATGAQATAQHEVEGIDALAERAGPDDALPEQVDLRSLDETIVLDSVRYLGEGLNARYWAAVDASGSICLVSFIDGKDWVAGATCTDPKAFTSSGAGLRLLGPNGSAEGYLVPDEVLALEPGLVRIASNLAVADPDGDGAFRDSKAEGLRGSGFALRVFETPLEEKVGVKP